MMKYSTLTLFLFISIATSAQKLTNSPVSGKYTYVFKLTDKEALEIARKADAAINESFLHTRVDSFLVNTPYKTQLPYGAYLQATPIENNFKYVYFDVKNVEMKVVNDKLSFRIFVEDNAGNFITGAKVSTDRGARGHLDTTTKLFTLPYPKKDQVILVNYQGITNFFIINTPEKSRVKKPVKEDRYFKKLKKQNKSKIEEPPYRGYFLTSKPKYKPLDTVKFKAYIVTNKGAAIQHVGADVFLYRPYNPNDRKKIATITPYKDGGYEFSFALSKELNLQLDNQYTIELAESTGQHRNMLNTQFTFEDYELKSLNFSFRSDKQTHKPGAPISIYFKAVDENELTVPDARVKLTIVHNNYISNWKDYKVFVPDTLWTKELKLDPMGETKLVLPDSIFPRANLNFVVIATLLNSNNESRKDSKSFDFICGDTGSTDIKTIKTSVRKDSLYFEYLVNGKPVNQKATLTAFSFNETQTGAQAINLPGSIKINPNLNYYRIETESGKKDNIFLDQYAPKLNILALQEKDSLRISVKNDRLIPFWYTVHSGNKILLKGYAKELDTVLRNSGMKGAGVRIFYKWGNDVYNESKDAIYDPNALSVKLIAPPNIYPGQEVKMLVKVVDIENQAVPDADITAYAVTAKFETNYAPPLPRFATTFINPKFRQNVRDEEIYAYGNLQLDWLKWGKALGLDTIEYYKFTHPGALYTTIEPGKDTITQVAPFAVIKGAIQPVHILYIDGVPVYFNQAKQLKTYAFAVSPGRHSIIMRLSNALVTLPLTPIEKGKKTIISIEADSLVNGKAVVKYPDTLTPYESELLNKYMFKVSGNFQMEKATILADTTRLLLNPPPNINPNTELLVGPVKENYLRFNRGSIAQDFVKEPGYTYTFMPGLIKQKSYDQLYAFNRDLKKFKTIENYRQYVLTNKDVDSIWNEYLNLRSAQTQLVNFTIPYAAHTGGLSISIDTSLNTKIKFIKNVIIYKQGELDFVHIYRGNERQFFGYAAGNYRMVVITRDNSYFEINNLEIKAGGRTNYHLKDVHIKPADNFSLRIDSAMKAIKINNNYYEKRNDVELRVTEIFNDQYFPPEDLKNVVYGSVIGDDGVPIPGATVKVLGLSVGTSTGIDGKFRLITPARGKLLVNYLGYFPKVVDIKGGNVGNITLEVEATSLDAVVITASGVTIKRRDQGNQSTIVGANEIAQAKAFNVDQALSGKVAGLMVRMDTLGYSINPGIRLVLRGNRSLTENKSALVIIDGLIVPGTILSSLNPEEIDDIRILSGTEGAALYGADATNGVLIITTKKGNSGINLAGGLIAQQQTMRTNFSDVGFWQPKLVTNQEGIASFTVKFPDDITNWKARAIAMNGFKQAGMDEVNIKSFKTLSANFVAPQFAVAGDSIKVLGKLMNYNPSEEWVTRNFSYNHTSLRNGKVTFKNAYLDTIPVVAATADSLVFEYTLKKENGYFDGEIRKIPVFAPGVLETKGYFSSLKGDTSVVLNFEMALGSITVRAESSVFPVFLDEIEKIRKYEYLCNEQLASKLKALLLEKKVRAYLKQDFKHEKDIKDILKLLKENKRFDNTWGWWQNSRTELWISLHVVEALLEAEAQGYPTGLNKDMLYRYLISQQTGLSNNDKVYGIKLLYLLDNNRYIKDLVINAEKETPHNKRTLYDQLELMYLKQLSGIRVNTDSLLAIKKKTMFGNIYWGEPNYNFWDNSVQNTLLAYTILRKAGKYSKELELIQQYFLEQRKDGQWRNTFESARILETILPDMLGKELSERKSELVLNSNEKIDKFPFERTFENTPALKIDKTGNMPIYFTAYQQFQNPAPLKVEKEFKVNSSFISKGKKVSQLKGGEMVTLKVDVEVSADADYVMIEVPIPAGCSYENKEQRFWGLETHRAYFKDKTSIFCEKLKQGKYSFSIDLMPRYGGNYTLNPAKAEMMYFPVFYGREGMKRIAVN